MKWDTLFSSNSGVIDARSGIVWSDASFQTRLYATVLRKFIANKLKQQQQQLAKEAGRKVSFCLLIYLPVSGYSALSSLLFSSCLERSRRREYSALSLVQKGTNSSSPLQVEQRAMYVCMYVCMYADDYLVCIFISQ